MLLGLLAMLAWQWPAPAHATLTDCGPANGQGYAQPERPGLQSVVVYIHGLHGDARETWLHSPWWPRPGVYWPCLLLQDREAFGDSKVFVADYLTRPLGTNPDVAQAATQVAGQLQADNVFGHADVTLVAHSMGGLVVAKMLTLSGLLSDDQRKRIRLVLFMGTPTEPGEAAALCKLRLQNRQCQEMSDPKFMAGLWDAWRRLPDKPAVWCIAEDARMFLPAWPVWLWIVPASSAHGPCPHPDRQGVTEGLHHSAMVKPAGLAAPPHSSLVHAFKRCVRSLWTAKAQHQPSPDEARREAVVRIWMRGLKQAMPANDADLQTLQQWLGLVPNNHRFVVPPAYQAPELRAAAYQERTVTEMSEEMLRLPAVLRGEIAWVRSVRSSHYVLVDGAAARLLDDLKRRRALRDDDVLVALEAAAGDKHAAQQLLVLRMPPGQAEASATAGGSAANPPQALQAWLWGVLNTVAPSPGCAPPAAGS